MARLRIVTLGVVSLLLAACGPGGATTAPSGPASAAPPTQVASLPPAETAAPTQDACAKENLQTLTAGTLTVGADNPAFPPYFIPSDPAPEGSELGARPAARTARASRAPRRTPSPTQLGFTCPTMSSGSWHRSTPRSSPARRTSTSYLTQVTYSPARAERVDLSDGYFTSNQAVVAIEGTAIADVTTVAGLKDVPSSARRSGRQALRTSRTRSSRLPSRGRTTA